jgi:hypothetical protein
MFKREVYLLVVICVLVSMNLFAGLAPTFPYLTPDKIVNATANRNYNTTYTVAKTVDGSGMEYVEWTHDKTIGNMWLGIADSDLLPSPVGLDPADYSGWVSYELDQVYELGQMWIWNYNQAATLLGRCLKDVWVDYSQDGTSWTRLMNGEQDYYTLSQATGLAGLEHTDEIDFAGAAAKYVTITAKSLAEGGNYGDASYIGLSEVLIGQVPEPATMSLLALGGLLISRRKR